MKKLLIAAAALPVFACALRAQEDKPASPHHEEVKKASPAAWLGIAMQENDGKVSVAMTIPGSPAAKAGLQEGDVILSVDGKPVKGAMKDLTAHITAKAPGDTIELRISRGDQEETLKIQLAERPNMDAERGEFRRAEKTPDQMLKEALKASEEAQKEAARAQAKLQKKLMEKAAGKKDDDDHGDRNEEDDDDDEMGEGHEKAHARGDKKPDVREEFRGWQQVPGRKGKAPLLRWYAGPGMPGGPEMHFRQFEGQLPQPLARMIPGKVNEDRIWKQVEQSVGRALKEAGVPQDVAEKAMQAVKSARQKSGGGERARLESEAAKIEKELQALKARQEKLREQLKATE